METASGKLISLVEEMYLFPNLPITIPCLGKYSSPDLLCAKAPITASTLPISMLTSSSESSCRSSPSDPPMTKEDIRIIFGNITDLATFSESFAEHLQGALGEIFEEGKGDDRIGALFLKMVRQDRS